jgi:hypothetical protein
VDEGRVALEPDRPAARPRPPAEVDVLAVHPAALAHAAELAPGVAADGVDGSARGVDRPRLAVVPVRAPARLPAVGDEPRETERADERRRRPGERDDARLKRQVLVQRARHGDPDAVPPQRVDEPRDARGAVHERVVVQDQVVVSRQPRGADVDGARDADVRRQPDEHALAQLLLELREAVALRAVVDDDDPVARHPVAGERLDAPDRELGLVPVEDHGGEAREAGPRFGSA